MANQYTEAREAGISPGDPDWPKQAETRREHPEEVRAKIRASVAASFLQGLIENESADVGHRVSASKILLDKTLASLSSVDQTTRDVTDELDHESLKAKLKAIVLSNPALLSEVMAELAKDQPGINPVKAA